MTFVEACQSSASDPGAERTALRSESRFEVPARQLGDVEGFLARFGGVVDHDKSGTSSILSFYYECEKIRTDNNGSIRQRTYLDGEIGDFLRLPCVVDAKVELSGGLQFKWRRSYGSWLDANALLTAPASERPEDLFPEFVAHYGGLGELAIPYGILYRRRYFALHGGSRATLDSGIQLIDVDRALGLVVAHTLPHSILEIKQGAGDAAAGAAFESHLASLQLGASASKRAHARALLK